MSVIEPVQADTTAEAEALIAEARARARRRRQRIALGVVGAAAVAAGALVAVGGFPGGEPTATASTGPATAAAKASGPPAYFAGTDELDGGYTSPVIRASATGKLVADLRMTPKLAGYDPPYSLAAVGPDSFVVGMMTPTDCSSQFFRFQLNAKGKPGALTQVGPTVPGDLTSMAVSAGGGEIGYSIDSSGCANARALGSYLAVLSTRSGQTRRWTDPSGPSGFLGSLSMSADGRELAFGQVLAKPDGKDGYSLLGDEVRVLPVDAPSGSAAARSRVVVRTSVNATGFNAPTVLLSPTGSSVYVCAAPMPTPKPGAKRITQTARITAYQTATGKSAGVLASFAASYPVSSVGEGGVQPLTVSCSSMALDPSGQYVLVPYLDAISNTKDPYSAGALTAARISIATRKRSSWTLRFGERGNPGTMTVAW